MKITKENYELYFIDYLDGNLTDQDIIQLENFLLLYPEYRMELEGLEKTFLIPDNNQFPGKDLLRKPDLTLPVNNDNFDDFCAASIEGDLDENLTSGFKNYLEHNPEKLNDYLIYNQIKLVPDNNIIFPGKNLLKKAAIPPISRMVYYAVSIAAAITLVLIIMNYRADYTSGTKNSETANLIKTEIPLINPPLKEVVPEVREKLPVKIMNNTRETGINVNVAEKETRPEITDTESDKLIAEMIRKSDLFKKDIPEREITIPLLSENDINLPKSFPGIQPTSTSFVSPEKEYLSLGEFASKELNEKVLGRKENSPSRITIIDIASAGIRGINVLTGGRMKLEKKNNPGSETEVLAFESRLIGFSTRISPKE